MAACSDMRGESGPRKLVGP